MKLKRYKPLRNTVLRGFRASPELCKRITEYAAQRRMNESEALRQLLIRALEQQEKAS